MTIGSCLSCSSGREASPPPIASRRVRWITGVAMVRVDLHRCPEAREMLSASDDTLCRASPLRKCRHSASPDRDHRRQPASSSPAQTRASQIEHRGEGGVQTQLRTSLADQAAVRANSAVLLVAATAKRQTAWAQSDRAAGLPCLLRHRCSGAGVDRQPGR